MSKLTPRVLKGFRDYLPEVMLPRQRMLRSVAEVFESFGFVPLDTPALEYTELLTGKYGDEGEGLLYRFKDNGGRDVALRYDLTVPLARLMGSHPGLPLPLKRYHMGTVWRAEKPGRGRFREFMQCDVDIVGSTSLLADFECVQVDAQVLRALGLRRFSVRVNHRQVLNGVLEHCGVTDPERGRGTLRVVDKLDKIGQAKVVDLLVAEQGWSPAGAQELLGLLTGQLQDLPLSNDALRVGRAQLSELLELAAAMDLEGVVRPDLSIARGLDYYTGTVFETFLDDLPGFGSVMSGGRYDGLIGLFRGNDIPAVGISLGVDRLLAGLTELDLVQSVSSTASVLVPVFSEDTQTATLQLAAHLRAAGLACDVPTPPGRKLKKQYRYADQRGIPVVALVGPSEVQEDTVRLKRLATGEEAVVPRDEAAGRIRQWLA